MPSVSGIIFYARGKAAEAFLSNSVCKINKILYSADKFY